MSYLDEFKAIINSRDFPRFVKLWDEYCTCDTVDVEELLKLLRLIKNSELARSFGQIAETALPLYSAVEDKEAAYEILKLIIDLETTNTPKLAEIALEAIKSKYQGNPHFDEWLRLVGLRTRDQFQGAIANFDLLAHMKKGNFVFHPGGWGTGEIMDVSSLREQLTIEFEHVAGKKVITFSNAFKTIIPLKNDNFLVRRFAFPDQLETEAKENPVEIIKILLRDLGPKTASEIKDELCEWVIPEKDWTKWWQWARTRTKKDSLIETPVNIKDEFKLRKDEISPEERLKRALQHSSNPLEMIQKTYSLVRDMPNILKNQNIKNSLREKLLELAESPELSKELELQIFIFLETMFNEQVPGKSIRELITNVDNIEEVVNSIEIIAFKKRALTAMQEYRDDWKEHFLSLLFSVPQTVLRDYIFKELNQGDTQAKLKEKITELLHKPKINPEVFVWYFQKVMDRSKEEIFYNDVHGRHQFFEYLLILLNYIENKPEFRELVKKIYQLISGQRYLLVRNTLEGASLEYIKEVLLLVTKCQTLTDHDIKIIRSLAEVANPALAGEKPKKRHDSHVIWTTEKGYMSTQERIKQIGTVETVENAREIEAARALGDLRENSEYKFALEKRSRLQSELKTLSEQLNKARILTKDDIHLNEVGVGNIVTVSGKNGVSMIFTILGPWDANPEENILSFQSKLAQSMVGCRVGDTFEFKGEEFSIKEIRSFLE